jgi:lipopolysaccharide export system protein LptC
MMARGTLWLPLLLLVFLAALSFWLDQAVQTTGGGRQNRDFDPESIVEGLQAQRSDRNGRMTERLSARRLLHYSGTDVAELEAPHFVQLLPDAAVYDISAARAHIVRETQEVTLTGQVHARQIPADKHAVMTFVTEKLVVDRSRGRIRAPGPVTVSGPGLTVAASAMDADSTRRLIKLFGRVRAQYQNAKR